MNAKIKHMIIEAELPRGVPIGDLSRKYPESSFNVTNGHWMEEDERIIYITGKGWKEDYYTFLKRHPCVIAIDRIGNIIKIHMKSRLLMNLEQKNMTLIYPTILKDGKHKIEFLIDEKQLQDLKQALPRCKVLHISDSYKPKVELTERQEEIISRAQSLGYFKYPREVTLTELAKLFKISKATLSQTLRTVENKAIKNILAWRGEQ